MIYFDLLSMRLFKSHDSGHKFCGLIRVDFGYFIVLFLDRIFFNFILQQCVY
jgi:hypothetical protein